ncbi:PKD domain-containing protein, partial [Methanosarcina spelaei]|uniref:PKD domain-containing protein n=1 Tax=Methanosarcina spelaei TaxID=1036679 RepID=UPI001FEADC5C
MKKITLLAFLSIFLLIGLASPALAADITGERTLNTTGVKAGESFRVTLNVTVSGGTLYSLGIDENLPDGWTVTTVQNDGMTYDAENIQWGLIDDMSSGKKTVIYDVFVPATEETGTYLITGKISGKEWTDGDEIERQNNITGDTNVTVGVPDINIYPGDDVQSILKNAPEGSTVYLHAGNYTGSGIYSIQNSLHIIGDGANLVNLTNIGWSESSGTTIEGIHFITRGPQFTSNSNYDKIRNCIFENALVQIQDDSLLENCTFTGTSYITAWTSSGGGTIRNNLFEVSLTKSKRPVYLKDNINNFSVSNNKFVNNSLNYEVIYVLTSQNTSITDNIFDSISTASSVIGISDSANTVIQNNTFKNCNSGKGAIEFQTGAQKVTVYLNNFINCSSLTSGSGTDVSWSSPSELNYKYAGKDHIGTLGNYFDQYKGTDADGNGIGDTSYPIGSGADYAPLISPIENYGNITVAAPQLPVADFDSNVTSGSVPLSVNFTDLSTNLPTSWAWDFDNDGKVDSTDQNPTYTYTAAGNYTVNLTVTNSVGSNSTVKTDYINVSESSTPTEPTPVAAFTADVTSGTAPLQVNFTDQSTGSPTSWLWDFGDGFNDTEQNVSHIYKSAGNYTVNLTVSNENGTNSTSALITVSEKPVTVLPIANFSTNVTSGTVPLSVQFTDLSENTTDWTWDFGDGSSATEQNPMHTYAVAGSYTVNLTVSNADGSDSEVKTGYIKVTVSSPGKPVASFSASPASGKVPLTVAFTDKSSNIPTKWKWSFGDGTSSTQQNPKHKYSKAGKYTVTLTVTNAKGSNTVTETDYIKVISKPVSNFTSSVTS